MSLPIIGKELREHGPILLVSGLLSMIALIGFVVMGEESGGRFSGLRSFLLAMGTLNALVAANRLLVREYAGRTQLFLEVLPISRARVFVTKWLLGAAWLELITIAAWAAVLRYQRKTEVIATSDALHVLYAALLFALAVWAFAALAGMLGRHRYTVWVAAFLTLALAVEVGRFSPEDVPLFALIGDRMVMARGPASLDDVLWAVGSIGALIAGAAALALIGSGAIASALARRMTARERVFVLVAGLVAVFVISLVNGKRGKPPFEVSDAIYVQGEHARIGVMATEDLSDDRMLALCRSIAGDVDAAIEALDLAFIGPSGPFQPAIYVTPQRGLDKRLVERAALSKHEGIVLRAAPDVAQSVLRSQVVHELIADASLERAGREDRHVLLDGFGERLVMQGDASARELSWLRLASIDRPIDALRLTRWQETMEQLGECSANALAFATAEALSSQLGEAGAIELLKAIFARPPSDVRVLLETSPSAQLERAGTSWAKLAAGVEAQRARLRAARSTELATIPKRTAWIDAKRSAERGATVRAHVRGAAAYRVLYAPLGPWMSSPSPLARLDVRGAQAADVVDATVPVSLAKGAHLFVAIELEEPVLQCPVRLRAVRLEVP